MIKETKNLIKKYNNDYNRFKIMPIKQRQQATGKTKIKKVARCIGRQLGYIPQATVKLHISRALQTDKMGVQKLFLIFSLVFIIFMTKTSAQRFVPFIKSFIETDLSHRGCTRALFQSFTKYRDIFFQRRVFCGL